jgi:hypothetical protein
MSVSKAVASAIRAVGGDPSEPGWDWLALNGPHGDGFTWAQTKNQPPGYVGVEHLERIVAQRHDADPSFRTRARDLVRMALVSTDVGLLRRAVQVAAVIGAETELHCIQALTEHEDEAVAADAKASAFYLKRRLKRTGQQHDA